MKGCHSTSEGCKSGGVGVDCLVEAHNLVVCNSQQLGDSCALLCHAPNDELDFDVDARDQVAHL